MNQVIRDVWKMVGEVMAKGDPGRPGLHLPEGAGLLFQTDHTSRFIKGPELRVRVLGAVIRARFIEPDFRGEGVVIEEPNRVHFTGEEARPTGGITRGRPVEDLLSWLGAQFTSMMDIKDATISKDGVEDVEDFLHSSSVVLIPTVELGKGINDDEGRAEVGHDLNEVRNIVRVVNHVKGSTKGGRIKDDKIPLVSVRPIGRQGNAFLTEHLHPFKPERVGSVELEIEHPTPSAQGRPTEKGVSLGNREANLKGQVGLPSFGWTNQQDSPWTGEESVDQVLVFARGEGGILVKAEI